MINKSDGNRRPFLRDPFLDPADEDPAQSILYVQCIGSRLWYLSEALSKSQYTIVEVDMTTFHEKVIYKLDLSTQTQPIFLGLTNISRNEDNLAAFEDAPQAFVFADNMLFLKKIKGLSVVDLANRREEVIESENLGASVVAFSDGFLYYVNAEYELTRYDPASHTSSLVNGIRTTAFYASRSVICYSNLEDNGYLYFADLSGENIKKVTDVFSENMQVRGEWIYYSDQNDGMRLYRIRMNGQNRELLCADPVFFYTLLEESTDILIVGEPNNPNENVGLYHLDTLTGKLSTLESSWYE